MTSLFGVLVDAAELGDTYRHDKRDVPRHVLGDGVAGGLCGSELAKQYSCVSGAGYPGEHEA